jgi:hypothetical protein
MVSDGSDYGRGIFVTGWRASSSRSSSAADQALLKHRIVHRFQTLSTFVLPPNRAATATAAFAAFYPAGVFRGDPNLSKSANSRDGGSTLSC